MMTTEEWREFPGYENVLEVSNFGRVRKKARLDYYNRVIPAKMLKLQGNYLHTSIDSVKRVFDIRNIVASVFLPVPEELKNENLVVVTINESNNYSVDNLKYIPVEEFHKAEAKKYNSRAKTPVSEKTIKRSPEAIIQMRVNGEFVRRYRDINEVLEVHPLWNEVDLMMSLTDFMSDAYGYKWRYECR